MGIIEVVKKGFVVATKNLNLVLILIVFNVIGNLVSLPFTPVQGTQPSPEMSAPLLIFTVVFVLISIFIQGGTLGAVRDYVKEGKMKLSAFASYGAKYYLKLLLLGIVIVAVVVIVALIAALIIAVTAPLNNKLVTIIATIIAMIIGIIATLLYFIPLTLSPYALVCDEIGVIEAVKKSLKVAKNPFKRVFTLLLLFIVLMLISIGIVLVIGYVLNLLIALLPSGAGRVATAVVTGIINGYLGVVMTVSFTAYYLMLTSKQDASAQ